MVADAAPKSVPITTLSYNLKLRRLHLPTLHMAQIDANLKTIRSHPHSRSRSQDSFLCSRGISCSKGSECQALRLGRNANPTPILRTIHTFDMLYAANRLTIRLHHHRYSIVMNNMSLCSTTTRSIA